MLINDLCRRAINLVPRTATGGNDQPIRAAAQNSRPAWYRGGATGRRRHQAQRHAETDRGNLFRANGIGTGSTSTASPGAVNP
ncbi:hypothetical protein M4D79_04155 [Mycolicibacterium novocastrense]|nr:hypothetical protein M4D79_04155 [Mycolicibacterium novocastrense]